MSLDMTGADMQTEHEEAELGAETTSWIERFVHQARALRRHADKAEREFIEFLREGEAQSVYWQPVATTFDRFLRLYDIVEPSRYRNACKAIDEIDHETVDSIGVKAAVQAVRVPAERREIVLQEMRASADVQGVPLSEQNARRIVGRYQPSRSLLLGKQDRVALLEAENRRLKKELREAKREITVLRAKLAKAAA